MPCPMNSRFGSIIWPERMASAREIETASSSPTSAMAKAAEPSVETSSMRRPGRLNVASASSIWPTVATSAASGPKAK